MTPNRGQYLIPLHSYGYPSEDISWYAIILDDCHLLESVSISLGYPPEKDKPINHTQQSNEERDDDMRLECISFISCMKTEQLT